MPLVLAVLRARGEESSGRAELVLATGLSRVRWLGSHLAVAVLGGGLLSRVAALGLAVAGVGSTGTGDTALFGTAIGAAMAYQPAHRVTAGVTVALYGWVPRLASPAWVVPGYTFLVGYLGRMLQMPGWMEDLSPYSIVPTTPAEDLTWAPLLGLTGLAALLVALGVVGFRRRSVDAAGAAGACWRPRSSTPFMRHETEEMLGRWAEHRKTLP